MFHDLNEAAKAARYLASMVASIRALPIAGASEGIIKRLAAELADDYLPRVLP